jgi:hypothetical protein
MYWMTAPDGWSYYVHLVPTYYHHAIYDGTFYRPGPDPIHHIVPFYYLVIYSFIYLGIFLGVDQSPINPGETFGT